MSWELKKEICHHNKFEILSENINTVTTNPVNSSIGENRVYLSNFLE